MTNILIASDSFKGSATSLEVADYLSKGMRQVDEKLE
jgi:Glycerate kinase